MPRKSPFIIRLTSNQAAKLTEIARKYTSPYCDVVRAKAILYVREEVTSQRLNRNHCAGGKSRVAVSSPPLGDDGVALALRRCHPPMVPPKLDLSP